MVEGAVSVVAEILVPLLLGIVEAGVAVVVASIRPWRYILSATYRARMNANLRGHGVVAKWWHILWGAVIVFLSVAMVACVIWVIRGSPTAERPNSLREVAMHKASELVAKRAAPASEVRP